MLCLLLKTLGQKYRNAVIFSLIVVILLLYTATPVATTLAAGCNYRRGGGGVGMRPDLDARGVFSEVTGGVGRGRRACSNRQGGRISAGQGVPGKQGLKLVGVFALAGDTHQMLLGI